MSSGPPAHRSLQHWRWLRPLPTRRRGRGPPTGIGGSRCSALLVSVPSLRHDRLHAGTSLQYCLSWRDRWGGGQERLGRCRTPYERTRGRKLTPAFLLYEGLLQVWASQTKSREPDERGRRPAAGLRVPQRRSVTCSDCVLVVEDEEQVRVLAEGILEEAGYRIVSAATIPEALALLRGDTAVEAIFTDLQLAENGPGDIELGAEARTIRPKVKVLYTSGQGTTDGTKALMVEGSTFLPKPYTPEQLTAAIAGLFAG
jgi:CheY-like chemotaxis protein